MPESQILHPHYQNIQKTQLTAFLLLCGEPNLKIDTVDVPQETLQFLISVTPNHKSVIHVSQPTLGKFESSSKYAIYKFLHVKVSYYSYQTNEWGSFS